MTQADMEEDQYYYDIANGHCPRCSTEEDAISLEDEEDEESNMMSICPECGETF